MFITVIAGDQHDPTTQQGFAVTDAVYMEKTCSLKVICISWRNLQPKPRSQTWLWVGGSSDGRSCPQTHRGSHWEERQPAAVTNSTRCFSTRCLVRAVSTEAVAVCDRKKFLFLSLGIKTSSPVTGTHTTSCYHLQPAVLDLQVVLLKILLLWLWPLKGVCICLLPYLFAYWAWVFDLL